jgi:hypothetical protein
MTTAARGATTTADTTLARRWWELKDRGKSYKDIHECAPGNGQLPRAVIEWRTRADRMVVAIRSDFMFSPGGGPGRGTASAQSSSPAEPGGGR